MTKVTVLMPAYNSAKTIGESIRSVLSQTFTEFEFLIADDGSTDGTRDVIQTFSDPRIRMLRNERNLGLIATLNLGFREAKGEWIARIDADDRMLPHRLERQLRLLQSRPEIDVLGSSAFRIDETGKRIGKIRKPSGKEFGAWAWLPTPLIHPAVILRASLARTNPFDGSALHCEDYELWLRLLKNGAHFENLTEPQIEYRVHSGSVSARARDLQLERTYAVFSRYYPGAGISASEFYALIGVPGAPFLSIFRRVHLIQKFTGRSIPPKLAAQQMVLTARQLFRRAT